MRKLRESAVLLAALLALASCSPQRELDGPWRSPVPVLISGGDSWMSLFPGSGLASTVELKGEPKGLMLRDEAVLTGTDDVWAVYRAGDGRSFDVNVEGPFVRLLGRVISITLGADAEAWEWLRAASGEDLRGIRTVVLGEAVDPSRLAELRRLGELNSAITLVVGGQEALNASLTVLRPRALVVQTSLDAQGWASILGQRQLETLALSDADGEPRDLASSLPRLRRLMFQGPSEGAAPFHLGALPSGLRSVVISISSLGAAELANLPADLEELSLSISDIPEMSALARFANLRALDLSASTGITDLSGLKTMDKLAWVAFPPGLSQDQFDAFVSAHPGLKVVEVTASTDIHDLSVLGKLPELSAIMLGSAQGEFGALRAARSLKFVGLPSDVFTSSPEAVAELRKSLPDTLVVPIMPLCLGSGWILVLVIPLAFLWLRRKRT